MIYNTGKALANAPGRLRKHNPIYLWCTKEIYFKIIAILNCSLLGALASNHNIRINQNS